MKKTILFLAMLSLTLGGLSAQTMNKSKDAEPKGKTLMIQGILIDTSCYFEEGQKDNEHAGMKTCGAKCLESGVPAWVFVGDKVYILIFPAKAFAGYVGKTVEIKGEPYGDNLIHPQKASVVDKDGKKEIKLVGFEMM